MALTSETALEALVRLGCPLGLKVGERNLDSLLKPMMLPLKTVEICGDSGTGKSMLCYTLAVEALAARPDSVVYWLDSNASFRSAKLMQIYRVRRSGEEDVEDEAVLSRVFVKTVYNEEELTQSLQGILTLGEDPDNPPVAAVIIDSVAGVLEETSWRLRNGGRARQESVVRQLMQIKRLLGTTVICTNRVVMSGDGCRAGLGPFWNQTITQRLLLLRTPGAFEIRRFPDGRTSNDTVVRYTIGDYGISDDS